MIGLLAIIGAAYATTSVDVFVSGETYPCYRQPVLVQGKDNILAFSEARNNTDCSGTTDGYPKWIVLRRSSDGGKTWDAIQTLYEGQIDFLTAMYVPATSESLFMIQQGSTTVMLTRSSDDGATWSSPAAIPVSGSSYSVTKPAVGHGIVLGSSGAPCSAGSAAGRLVMPFVCQGNGVGGDFACADCHSCLALSDDSGKSWRLGAVSPQLGSREPSVVEVCASRSNGTLGGNPEKSANFGGNPEKRVSFRGNPSKNSLPTKNTPFWESPTKDDSPSSTLYLNERNMGATAGHKFWAESVDGGESINAYGLESSLVGPLTHNWTGVVSSVARTSSAVLFAGVGDMHERANMTLRCSTDEAQTWKPAVLSLWEGPAGYSDSLYLGATGHGVLFENGKVGFAEKISLQIIDQQTIQNLCK